MEVTSWPSAAESAPSYLLSFLANQPTENTFYLAYYDGTDTNTLFSSNQFAIYDFAYGNDGSTGDLSQVLIGLTNGSVLQTSLE